MTDLQVAQYVPVDSVPGIAAQLRASFASGRSKPMAWRVQQIKGLRALVSDNRDAIAEARRKDLAVVQGGGLTNAFMDHCDAMLANLSAWTADQGVGVPIIVQPAKAYVTKDPLGVVAIISPWNYPIDLCLEPLLGAVAAGNCALVKPSEVSVNCGYLLWQLMQSGRYVDTKCIQCVLGGIPETTAILQQRWDHIFYTGATPVGKIILRAAAEHLTPVTLELGGKSPVIVDHTAKIDVAVKRIAWGKAFNSGQNCISPDYVLIEESIHDEFVDKLRAAFATFFPDGAQKSPDYGRVINQRHMTRLQGLMSDVEEHQIALGGKWDDEDDFFEPTILVDVAPQQKVMQEEIFGPILPILKVPNVDAAIAFINEREKPLSLYLFSECAATTQQVSSGTSSGSFVVNDVLFQYVCPNLPFGGVGHSGMGSYHGKASIDVFSHQKSCLKKATWIDPSIRYPPYTAFKTKALTSPLPSLPPALRTPFKWCVKILFLLLAAYVFHLVDRALF